MCILCVASRWSRRIVTMLPCLIIPSIILWTLSQLLPPGVRFEVTSPRLACLAVILAILGWYELAMPRLSSWRAKRSALLREKRRTEEREAAKWRKEATRRCRNCFAPYRDQTPGGGRYMCTYCGHVSRRPVLDVPGGAHGTGMGGSVGQFPLTGSSAGLVNGGGIISKVWSGRGFPDRSNLMGLRSWMGARPWTTEGGGYVLFGSPWLASAGSFGASGAGWGGTVSPFGVGMFGGDKCSVTNSYSGVVLSVLNIFYYTLFGVEWICQKLQGAGGLGDSGIGAGHGTCQFRDDDAGPLPGTRGDKAKRKAEEKRQARLEKEQLEAEERKQREEVSRLVEERRRQRDEKLEAEKEREREAAAEREREAGQEKEGERRRQEKTRGREKVQARDKSKDQESEDRKRKKGKENENRTATERNERKEDFKATLVDGVESGKIGKASKGAILEIISSKGNESGVKGSASNASKSRFLSQSKRAAASQNNTVSFWGRTFSTSSNPVGNLSKATMPSVSSPSATSNLSAWSNKKCVEASGSACKTTSWTNVCDKETSQMPDDTSKMLLDVVDGSDHRSDTSDGDAAKDLINGTIVSSPCTVGVPLKPIAPPSNIPNSCDNLFFSPSVFPLMELPVDSGPQDKRQHIEIGKKIHQERIMNLSYLSLPSSQNYFGMSPPMAMLSSEASAQVPMSRVSSIAVEAASPSSLLPGVSDSLKMADFVGVVNSDIFSLRGHVSDSLMTSFSIDLGTSISSHSPMHAPFLDPMQVSHGTKKSQLPQILEPWGVPPLSFGDTNDNITQGTWSLWGPPQIPEVKLREPSPLVDLLDQGRCFLQPLPQSSNLEPESHLSSLFSPQLKHGSLEQSFGKPPCLIPASGSNSIWLDSSVMESTKRIWENVDVQYKVPQEFVDCITHSLMEDPVITADGYSYERSAIEAWLKSHDTSPKTGEILPPLPEGNGTGVDKTLRPNHILRGQIIEYREQLARGALYEESLKDSSSSLAAEGGLDPSWSLTSSTTMRPHIKGLYPSLGVESVWSYNML